MKLVGKTAYFQLNGFRSGRIVRVDDGPRSGLRAIVVQLAGMRQSDGKIGHYGPRKKLSPRAFRGPLAGVMYRGELVPLDKARAHGRD